jgi:hypothetical protein
MHKRTKPAWVVMLLALNIATATGVHAQSSPSPGGSARGFVVYESFEGDSNSDGQVMVLSSSVAYHFNQHFSAGIGIPIYFEHASPATIGTASSISSGVGNLTASVRAEWKNPVLNYAATLTGTAPSGDTKKGLSTGHATFDWNNRLDHDFGVFNPFVTVGIANTITDTRYFLRPFTSYGYLAHFEAGTDVDLSHSVGLSLSGYDIAPWGTQTIVSRVVVAGASGKSGSVSHGRAFENSHTTVGTASLASDDGFNADLSFSPRRYLDLDLGYSRSVRYALNSVSFGVGVNLSSLFGKSTHSIR